MRKNVIGIAWHSASSVVSRLQPAPQRAVQNRNLRTQMLMP
jgi:hypothetical protein